MKIAILTVLCLLAPMADANSSDGRTAIALEDSHKTFVLERMRKMLETLTAIQRNLLANQPEQTDDLVQALKQYTAANHPVGLREQMPVAFRQMSQSMNQSWRKLSVEQTDSTNIQRELVNIMSMCNACHSVYKIE